MTHHGMPDCPRSARYILKDYVKVSPPFSLHNNKRYYLQFVCLQGKLLFCHCPPGVDRDTFNSEGEGEGGEMRRAPLSQGPEEEESENGSAQKPSQFDQQYFQQVFDKIYCQFKLSKMKKKIAVFSGKIYRFVVPK